MTSGDLGSQLGRGTAVARAHLHHLGADLLLNGRGEAVEEDRDQVRVSFSSFQDDAYDVFGLTLEDFVRFQDDCAGRLDQIPLLRSRFRSSERPTDQGFQGLFLSWH